MKTSTITQTEETHMADLSPYLDTSMEPGLGYTE
jgi:hypothetical protein